MVSTKCRPQTKNRVQKAVCKAQTHQLQSQTKLLEKVFPIMSTFLRNNTISKMTPLWKEIPFPQFNVASYKRPGIRLSFEDKVGHWEELVQLRCLEKFSVTIQFSLETVLSKIVGTKCILWQKKFQTTLRTSTKL